MKKYIILLIIIIIVTIILNIFKYTEKFTEQTLKLKSLNICGRQLFFKNQPDSLLLASQRATVKDSLSIINQSTNCKLPYNENNYIRDTSLSVISDNILLYSLKRVCLPINILGCQKDKNILNVSCNLDESLSALLLLNSLFIELSTKDKYSICYTIVNQNTYILSNYNENNFIISIKPIKNTCDQLFDSKNTSQSLLTASDLNKKMTINISAYYLDNISENTQNAYKTLNLNYNNTGFSPIFEKDYIKYIQNDNKQYGFMNIINTMYKNNIIPIMTFNFGFKIIKNNISDNKITIIKAYIEDPNYMYNDFPGIDIGNKYNNLFSMYLTKSKKYNYFKIGIISSENNNCGLNKLIETDLIYPENDEVIINTTITVTPYKKTLFFQWNSFGKNYYQFIKSSDKYIDIDPCSISTLETNAESDFYKIFTNNTDPKNISLAYDNTYIRRLNNITLGEYKYM